MGSNMGPIYLDIHTQLRFWNQTGKNLIFQYYFSHRQVFDRTFGTSKRNQKYPSYGLEELGTFRSARNILKYAKLDEYSRRGFLPWYSSVEL